MSHRMTCALLDHPCQTESKPHPLLQSAEVCCFELVYRLFRFLVSKLKIKPNNVLECFEDKNKIAKLVGAVLILVVVLTLVLIDVVKFIGVVAVVVVPTSMTSGRLFNVPIVTIPATQVATNITNQIMVL